MLTLCCLGSIHKYCVPDIEPEKIFFNILIENEYFLLMHKTVMNSVNLVCCV